MLLNVRLRLGTLRKGTHCVALNDWMHLEFDDDIRKLFVDLLCLVQSIEIKSNYYFVNQVQIGSIFLLLLGEINDISDAEVLSI